MSRETLRGTNRQAREINNESRGFENVCVASAHADSPFGAIRACHILIAFCEYIHAKGGTFSTFERPFKVLLCCAWVHWFAGGLCLLTTSMVTSITTSISGGSGISEDTYIIN